MNQIAVTQWLEMNIESLRTAEVELLFQILAGSGFCAFLENLLALDICQMKPDIFFNLDPIRNARDGLQRSDTFFDLDKFSSELVR